VRLVPALATAVAVMGVAFASCGDSSVGTAACASALLVDDTVYLGVSLKGGRRIERAGTAGTAVLPGCNDAGQDEPGREVDVVAVAGVPPEAAVATEGIAPTDHVYLAPGFLPALASHPLHSELLGTPGRWVEGELRERCRRPVVLRGTADDRTGAVFTRIPLAGRVVVLDGPTRYRGRKRAGLPHLKPGERVDVQGAACRGRRVVADLITNRS